jgi:2-haloacid dehalogenase
MIREVEANGRADRWATFDCYGTLIDWNGGIGDELERLFGAELRERMLARYHELEPQIERAKPTASYREVMADALAGCAETAGVELAGGERDSLGRSLPGWRAFEEVPAALTELRKRGWHLVILSNTDREFIDASMETIGVPFERAIVASEIGSYKPAPGHWREFLSSSGADPTRYVHVAASHFHDVEPTAELGIPCVWINREGEPPSSLASRELADLTNLPDVLEALVPA